MKIYIKKEMPEMPKGCKNCTWLYLRTCTADIFGVRIDSVETRPGNCPLVTRQEILEEKE